MLIDYFFNRKNIKLPTISDQEEILNTLVRLVKLSILKILSKIINNLMFF